MEAYETDLETSVHWNNEDLLISYDVISPEITSTLNRDPQVYDPGETPKIKITGIFNNSDLSKNLLEIFNKTEIEQFEDLAAQDYSLQKYRWS